MIARTAIQAAAAWAPVIILAVLAGRTWEARAWERRQARLDRPVPYWPASHCEPGPGLTDAQIGALAATIMCTSCRDRGHDPCTCTVPCGHPACTAGPDPAAVEFLRSLTMPAEGAEQ